MSVLTLTEDNGSISKLLTYGGGIFSCCIVTNFLNEVDSADSADLISFFPILKPTLKAVIAEHVTFK